MDEQASYTVVTGDDTGGTLTSFLADCGDLVDNGWLPAGGLAVQGLDSESNVYRQAFYLPPAARPVAWAPQHKDPEPVTFAFEPAPGTGLAPEPPRPVVPLASIGVVATPPPTTGILGEWISDAEWVQHFGEAREHNPAQVGSGGDLFMETSHPAPGEFAARMAAAADFMAGLAASQVPPPATSTAPPDPATTTPIK